MDLVPGDNVVQVEVTGADGATTLTYEVTVARGTTVDLGAIPADWSLKPDAVAAGEGFRLLFVSSTTRTGDSTDIALYNDHVQAAAAAGHADIQAFADDFTVVGSTLAVNARANTLTQAADTDAPIYWVNTSAARSAVADDYADFYDGTWDNPDGRTEAGATISLVANPVATGSLTDGATAAAALGGLNGFVSGWAVSDSGVTIQGLDSTAAHPLLGLSPVLRVAAEVTAELEYWSATLTIEEPNGESGPEGFCSADCSEAYNDYGGVSQETFKIAGVTYTVVSLRYGDTSADVGDTFYLELAGAGTANLGKVPGMELRIGEKSYVLTESSDGAGSFPTSLSYRFTSPTADERPWPEPPPAGAEADVRLVDAAPGCRVEVVGRTTIRWSKVTVGPGRSGLATSPPDYYGFDDANSVGALSDGAFKLGSTTDVGIVRVTVGTDGSLVFDESPDLPAEDYPALRLHVCGDAFDLADAPPTNSRHTWPNSGLDWSTERPVHVALSVAPPDATLSDLELKDNDGAGITLTPAFASVTTSYRATVANAVDEITVVPTPNDTAATVEIQDEDGTALDDADTGTDGFQVALRWGDNTIQVEVTATDGTTIGLYTVIVSRALARPSVSPTGGSTTGLDVSWEAPGSTTIVSYDVQYREGDSGSFTDGPQDVTGTGTSIPGLMMNTSYQVQVRATSAAGDSEWSPNGRGWTHAPEATVASDWSLLPGGLATGAKFRLLFVSHDTRWNQSQIDSYNGWVQEYAAPGTGHTAIRAHASGFRAVGCGRWVNARVNTGTQWSASDRGVPIHWLGGLTAADDYGDFYDGTWQNEDAPRTEAGALKPASFDGRVFTGCTNAGDTVTGAALGQEFSARGRLDVNGAGPLGGGANEKGNRPIYGLSQVFVVGASSDVTAPRVASIERRTPSSSPTNADSLTWRVTFNENVGNVDAADFAVAATTASLAVVEATASTVYDVTASGGDLAGLTATVTLSFASAQDIADAAGNALSNTAPTGANQAGYAVDNTGPTVTIAVPGTSSAPFEATFAFSEAVSGFGVGDIGVGNGAASDFGGADGDASYSAQIAPAANGAVTVDVAADVATDAAGNGNTAAAQATSDYTDANGDPTFDRASTSREVDENTPSGQLFGDAVSADDPDGDSLKYTLEGADAASFRIGRTTGRLRTSAALDHEAKPSHTLTVKADDERGGTDTIVVTVNVTDVDEPPAAPGAPTVSAVEGSATSLSVRWSAPANTGPRVTDYDLRHKKTGGGWTDGPENVTGRSATIGGLARDTEYEVQVLARNDEGESGWSPSGRRITGQAARSVHMEDVTVHEGETARFTIVFSPARSDDRLLWETHDNRARAGEDFPRTSRGIALQAGATEVTGEVEIYADDEAEDEERFQIAITFGDVGDTVEYAGSIYIRDGARSNTAPEFDDGTSTTREVAENTASGQPVGAAVSATDAEDDPLTYTLEGADAASFGIDRTTGRLRTSAALDHEAKASYTLRAKADDGHGGTARIDVTVKVTDMAEKPAKPAAPRVSATANATDSLDVAWTKPDLNGGPDIVGYKLRYEVSGSGSWTETTPSGTGTTATIGTLAEDTGYAVQVRALNGETPSDWSASGPGRTGGGSNTAPEFDDGTSTTREVAENTASGQPVGGVVEARDADNDTLRYTLEGADAGSFGIDSGSGQLRTSAPLDHESKSSYAVRVKADDNNGGTATIDVTVNVTDVAEKPARPAAPRVSATANATDSLDVAWTKPDLDGGPDIVGYKLRYEVSGSGSWTETTPSGTGTTATIGTLAGDTGYAVQVRALNGETPSDWSASGPGRTGGGSNTAPEFADGTSTTREVAENTASGQPVGGVVEADDVDDDPLIYTLEGADAASFGIDRTTGRLRTSAALDHESDPSYQFTVKADDERGGTATIVVTVNVIDVAEKPSTPAAPRVSATANATDSLDVAWTKPDLDGGPDIVGYKLRYEVSGSGSWTETTPSGTGTTATIGTLAEDTGYAVQVRALNGETPSDWSASGPGRTGGGSNTAPEFDDGTSTTREVAENTVPGRPVGAVVEADDADDDPLTYTLEGADAASFAVGRTTGQLRTGAALDHETKASYTLTVKADDGRGGTDTIVVTVNVADVDEPPGAPDAPTVAPVEGSETSLSASWDAPANTGPPMTYDLRYREPGGSWTDGPKNVAGSPATIGGLAADTDYQVQVLARNDEGASGWSPPGGGHTGGGHTGGGPTVRMADVTVHEGETARFTIVFSPATSDDRLIWSTHGNGRAREGEDFARTSRGIELEAGATEVEGAVEIHADDEAEDEERFQIAITFGREGDTVEYAGNIYIRDGESNGVPVFDDGARTTRKVAENTASGQPVGKAVTADDPNDDPVTYALEGRDAASFRIDAGTGQLRTRAALDHEAKAAYEVTVRADDDQGGTATIAVTVNVDDVDEKPATPAAPAVSATANATDSLDVGWRKPDLAGGPDIVGYRLRRGVRGGNGWFETTTRYPATARSATIDGLAEDTEYDVRVRALNGETTSDWSPPGFGRTGANAPPVFDDGAHTTRSVAENTASGRPVGRAVSADDANDDELKYTLEGPDAGSFGIDRRTGQLRASAALDHESKASHTLTVKADDGEGGTATIDVTVNATDVDEPPQAPDAPTVTGGETNLSVRWGAPENTGPRVTGYDLRYRETGGSWTDGPENVAGRSASIGGLVADTEYEVQVLARNDEGESGWSPSGGGHTGGGRSVHMADVAVHEGETARFTIVFSPAGSDDYLLWETHDNRARAGEDFPRTSRGIALQAGATEVTGEIEIYADDEAEDEERFQIGITFGVVGDTVESAGSIYINDGPGPASANPSARVVGDLLTLRYADALDAGSTPGPKDWVVRAATATGSRTLAVTGVSVSGAEVALVLSPAAVAGESVAVSYLPWAMHPLLGPQGAEAGPLTELPVRNETPAFAPVEPPLAPLDVEAGVAEEPTAGTPAPFGPWLSALLAERPAASLVRLDLPDRGLTDISALAGLTGLEVLDLHGNELADVWPLAGLANLRRLDLSANRIEDVSALAGLADLEVLLLDGNRVADVLPLALLPRLARLDLSGNRLADAVLLAELRSLARLDLSGNRVADASPLGDLSAAGVAGPDRQPGVGCGAARPPDGAALAVAGRRRGGARGAGTAVARDAAAHRVGRAGGAGLNAWTFAGRSGSGGSGWTPAATGCRTSPRRATSPGRCGCGWRSTGLRPLRRSAD